MKGVVSDIHRHSPLQYTVVPPWYGQQRPNDHRDLAQLLLSRGANVNARNDKGHTVLHNAALWGSVDVAECLLGSGADVQQTDHEGRTALHQSTWHDRNTEQAGVNQQKKLRIAQMLVSRGVDVHAVTHAGRTALAIAERYTFLQTRQSALFLPRLKLLVCPREDVSDAASQGILPGSVQIPSLDLAETSLECGDSLAEGTLGTRRTTGDSMETSDRGDGGRAEADTGEIAEGLELHSRPSKHGHFWASHSGEGDAETVVPEGEEEVEGSRQVGEFERSMEVSRRMR
uniref:Uncharacterized protein n=1 Tax=Chromera velia CCMP2878 TaxID=1169474 RepID=A0A0G4GC37_9ALVE|eukprot:Cvel_21218.t1-p1 / transcript=Cvel_21218.t1 / gene=Cvel_21218 / organism=Chromera_velia_CCMP2878 / gene_product=hypothetical protein / transcript_product=hypothetical protein / location=Cvel_scaffold1971:18079-24072(-) / protein_length=286 / sequence_SO=supercontig / SO=protein_coding / is_pseudo=false